MKKIFTSFVSLFLLIGIFGSSFIATKNTYAADTNTNWTVEHAEHLAKRALFSASQDTVIMLYKQGSREAAVDFLFAEPTEESKKKFKTEIDEFKTIMNPTSFRDNRELFVLKLLRDPAQSRAKLFTLFEDIFAVNTHGNVPEYLPYHHQWHDAIYKGLNDDYKKTIKKTFTLFAQARYLNLLNTNKNNPNQDFARELLQLFLMDEYHPLDKKRTGKSPYTSKNYSEADMENLAFLLTGISFSKTGSHVGVFPENIITFDTDFPTNESGKSGVYFHPARHNASARDFLGESVDIQSLKTRYESDKPATPELVVDYIFEKRKQQIANFLAWKILNFYVTKTPTIQENDWAAGVILKNNFNIIESVKEILKNDIMFDNDHINEFRYKNPLEIVIGTYQYLDQVAISDPYYACLASDNSSECIDGLYALMLSSSDTGAFSVDRYKLVKKCIAEKKKDGECTNINTSTVYLSVYLEYMGFTALAHPNIFGRPGMDNNEEWSSSATYGAAITNVIPRIIHLEETYFKNQFFDLSLFNFYESETSEQYVKRLETNFLQGKPLENTARTALITEIDKIITSNSGNNLTKIQLEKILTGFLSQPEYLSLSGYNNYHSLPQTEDIDTDHIMIFNWLGGGPDIMHMIIPTQDPNYNLIKGDMSVPKELQIDMVDKNGVVNPYYKMNKGFESFTTSSGQEIKGFDQLYKEGKLYVFTGVANTDQSYAHNYAREKIETGENGSPNGYIKKIFEGQNINPSQIVKIGGKGPLLRGQSVNSIPLRKIDFYRERGEITKSVLTARQKNPGFFSVTVPQVLSFKSYFDKNPNINISSSYERINFFKELIKTDNAKILATTIGGFDTHKNQDLDVQKRNGTGDSTGIGVRNRWRSVMQAYSPFFESFKQEFPDKELTIVLYSEFGRTVIPNKTGGTDHGRGGTFFVLTTASDKILPSIPQQMGRMNTHSHQGNNVPTNIDIRSIWDQLFSTIYNKQVFVELEPIKLIDYKKFDDAYYATLKAKNTPTASNISDANDKLTILARFVSENKFYSAHYKMMFERVKGFISQSISIPEYRYGLFSQYSFENNLGDSSMHPLFLDPLGNVTPKYQDGYQGKALELADGIVYRNDMHKRYSPYLKNRDGIEKGKQTITGWATPKQFQKYGQAIISNPGTGIRLFISDTGTTGKKLRAYFYSASTKKTIDILSKSSDAVPEILLNQWFHYAITTEIKPDGKHEIKIYINGNLVAEKSGIDSLSQAAKEKGLTPDISYRFNIGATENSTIKRHKVLIDELKIFGKVFSSEEIKSEYLLERIRKLELNENTTEFTTIRNDIQSLPDDFSNKKNLLDRLNAYKKVVVKYTDSIPNNIQQCIDQKTTWFPDKSITVKWNEKSFFTNKSDNKSAIKDVFIKGFDKGNIKWSYNKNTKEYIFSFHASDDPLWNCYIKENNFFKEYFEIKP